MRTPTTPTTTSEHTVRLVTHADPLLVDVLAARCHAALVAIEARGGPDVATHLAMLGHALSRTPRRAPSGAGTHARRDRARVERTLTAITTGSVAPGGEHRGSSSDLRLLTDLRRLERVLTRAARIGGVPDTVLEATAGPIRPGASHRAAG